MNIAREAYNKLLHFQFIDYADLNAWEIKLSTTKAPSKIRSYSRTIKIIKGRITKRCAELIKLDIEENKKIES